MGNKDSVHGIKIIKTLNAEFKSNFNNNNNNKNINNNKNKESNNSTVMSIPKFRRNAHTVKFLPNKNTNEIKLQTRHHIMTDEQRNIFKSLLKENVKENKISIAKNLEGIFLESYKENNLLQNQVTNNNEIDNILTQNDTNEGIIKNLVKPNNNNGQGILRTVLTLPTNKYSKKNLDSDRLKIDDGVGNNKFGKIDSSRNRANIKNKVSFTTFSNMQQKNSIQGGNISKKQNQPFSTPRVILGQTNLEKKFELENKKDMVFQRKSFRDYVENNNKKNYDECLKFINTTSILSHLEESDKSLLIQSLKVKNFKKDECILKSKEKCTRMYFVKEGSLNCVDNKGKCLRTLNVGDNFGEKEILINIERNFNVVAISNCVCYTISVRSFKKMLGHNFRSFIFFNFMKAAFECSKLFKTLNIFYIQQIYRFFSLVNLDKDNVAFPISHKKNSKFVIVISGQLKNSKNEEIIGRPLDILYEDELLSLCEDKIQYALNPSPDVLFFEGDVSQILKYLQCKSFHDILNKSLIFEHLSKIVLFKSFSQLKLDKLINLIHIEQYKNGEKIIQEGQKSEKFYIVKNGQVEVFQKTIYLRTLNSMEYFGERGLLANEVRSATVIAKNDVDLYCLDKESFNLNLSVLMSNYLHKSLSLHDETVTLDDLLFLKKIGKGSYGVVSLVMNERTQFPYAIKAISKNHINAEKLHNNIQLEKNVLLKIDHPFIVKLVKCLKDKTNIYFLMEYIKGKVLFDVIRDIGLLNKEQTNFYIASMIIAIHYLHERKIIYRDIKPENIIIKENGYLKLIDFGTAKEIEDRTKTIIGTPHYMAPEIIMGGGYSFQVDYWSISICMYEFMCGEVPFADKEEDPMEIYFEIINNHLTFPTKYVKIDKDFKHLMKKMLDKNPSYRLANYYSIKNNIWFKDFKWDELTNLNLKAPYLPIIPFDSFDFDVHCKPIFEYKKQDFQKYVDYIEKNTTTFELKEKIPKDKLIEYKKWYDRF